MSRLIFNQLGTTPSDTDAGTSQLFLKDDSGLYLKNASNTEVALLTGTGAMPTVSSGKVGIGTDSPDTLLHLEQDGARLKIESNTLNASASIQIKATGNTEDVLIGQNLAVNGSLFEIYDNTDARACLVIDGSGKVGFGTTTPEGLLHIKHATNSTDLSANHIFGLSTGNITISATPIAKAWAQFSGTDTSNIRQSYNVSSITDNSTGQYYVNFATDINDGSAQNDNYCVVATAGDNTPFTNQDFYVTASSDSTSRCYVTCWSIYHFHHVDNSANTDPDKVNIVVYSR